MQIYVSQEIGRGEFRDEIHRRNETQDWQDKRKPFYGEMHCYDKIVWMMLNIDMLNMK